MKQSQAAQGRRLTLRPVSAEDAPHLLEAVEASRVELKRRYGWAASEGSLEGERRFAENACRDIEIMRRLVMAIIESKSEILVGVISLSGMSPEDGRRAEMSLWIRSDRQGRGYGAESGKLMIDHAFRRLDLHRLYSRIHPLNRAGRKTLQKLGFRYEGCLREDKRLNGRWVNQECWGLLKSEWKK